MFPTLCTETLLLKAWDSVKSKNAGGGVDGLNVSDFDADIGKNIRELSEDLKAGQWEPQPYLRIEIPKKENEKRKLGLLTIRDKIVQQGIRLLIEPKCENLFFGNSYGYRPGKGATDLVNSLLNYGYSILYTRCWQALLAAQLNPYDSVIHVRQHGKPTFAFDFIEIFRAQAVDRVVISLIQKNEPLEIKDGHLSEDTRKLLVKNITERLYKRETFRKESMTLDRIIKVQAREIAQYFTWNKKFKPYKAKW